jgi:hypothetical protein
MTASPQCSHGQHFGTDGDVPVLVQVVDMVPHQPQTYLIYAVDNGHLYPTWTWHCLQVLFGLTVAERTVSRGAAVEIVARQLCLCGLCVLMCVFVISCV